jgi:hypothetical protein
VIFDLAHTLLPSSAWPIPILHLKHRLPALMQLGASGLLATKSPSPASLLCLLTVGCSVLFGSWPRRGPCLFAELKSE